MKLVDILARELKVWPEGAFAITQDYDFDINQVMRDFVPVLNEAGRVWRANPGMLEISTFETTSQSDDYAIAIVTRAEWQAAVDALNAPKANLPLTFGALLECGYLTPPISLHHQWIGRAYRFELAPEWSEDGLPNVGTKCVVHRGSYDLHADADKFIGPVVTVTARFKSARGIEMACVDSGGDGGCHVFRADMCFHLPTAEEIAFREREDAIGEMMAVAGMGSRKACAALYDRNYRKQVTK